MSITLNRSEACLHYFLNDDGDLWQLMLTKNIDEGYTQMIIHRIEELTQLYEQLMKSLNEKNTQNQDGKES